MNKALFFVSVALSALATQASAESIPNGTYQAQFGLDCGVLSVGETTLGYTYGPCGKDPVYVASKVSRSGDTLSIDKATYQFTINDKGHLMGVWTLNGYESKPIFWKQ